MSDQEPKFAKYPLLEALLDEKGLCLQGTYTNRDVANIFGVSTRTDSRLEQEWILQATKSARSRQIPVGGLRKVSPRQFQIPRHRDRRQPKFALYRPK
jgi:hypothetical protein